MKREIVFGLKKIEFDLDYVHRKSLGIKVQPNGAVVVLAPLHEKENRIINAVRKKAPWIIRQMEEFERFRPLMPTRRYVSGETHLYLGRQYRLKVISGNEPSIKLSTGRIEIISPDLSRDILAAQLEEWYKARSAVIFQEAFDSILPKFRRYNVKISGLKIRKMKSRWGSCSPSGRILLNLELVKTPRPCIEYVIAHELSHLVHFNHTAKFYTLLDKIIPDWKKWKGRLEFLTFY